MRILVVPDKFKGTLTAAQAAESIARGLRSIWPKAKITILSLSDGGEGFVQTLTAAKRGSLHWRKTTDALGQVCRARFGLCPGGIAIANIAEASGLAQVPEPLRNPGALSTEGTGRLLVSLAQRPCRSIHVGLGGSSTNDGGIGLAAPFGFQFLDRHGRPISLNGDGLAHLARIIPPERPVSAEFIAATDVENPLFGAQGAACQFAAQKGATPSQVKRLDRNLHRLAEIAQQSLGRSAHEQAGAGAAGGAGYGLMTFLNATRISGFDLFRQSNGLDDLISRQDLVITGEGCLDATSLHGKGPWRVAQLARTHQVPVWALCGDYRLPRANTPFAQIGTLRSFAPDLRSAQLHAGAWLKKLAAHMASEVAASTARKCQSGGKQ